MLERGQRILCNIRTSTMNTLFFANNKKRLSLRTYFFIFLFIYIYIYFFFIFLVNSNTDVIYYSRRVFLLFVTIENDDLNSLNKNKEREKNIFSIDKWSKLFEIGNMSQRLKLDRKILQLCNKIYNEGNAIKKKKKTKNKLMYRIVQIVSIKHLLIINRLSILLIIRKINIWEIKVKL